MVQVTSSVLHGNFIHNEKALANLTHTASTAGREQLYLRQLRKVLTHVLLNVNF